jgi:hypothetical protein
MTRSIPFTKLFCSKIKHLVKVTGNEDLYRSPDLRD